MIKMIKALFRCIKAVLHFITALAVFSLIIGILFPAQETNRGLLYALFVIGWFGYHFLCLRKPEIRNIRNVLIHAIDTLKALWKDETPPEEDRTAAGTEDSTVQPTEKPKKPEAKPEPKPYNIAAWYGIIARSILTDCITELNVRQIKSVCLMESGELVYGEDNEKAGKIETIPPKSCWKDICNRLEEDGLTAAAEPDRIRISWN